MKGGESGSEKGKLEGRNHIQYEVSVELSAFVCMNHYFHTGDS